MQDHISLKKRAEIVNEISKTYNTNDSTRIDEIFDRDYRSKHKNLIESELSEIARTQRTYAEYINKVDHVLLNTGTREDLAEQITNLIEHYK